ncbi:hypothetical protein HGRIS_003486 [Hohenbuehelia grisea]|uniref:Alpha-amylase n=1 Tax=Hohenbuehelia grisea TaxID=104357 RepID=A0ABR3JFW8_9AGAR
MHCLLVQGLLVLVSAMHCTLGAPHPTKPQDTSLPARGVSNDKNVIAQMFEWTWDSVAAECKDFIGPAGYGFVQVSPASEHVDGPQWFTDYQPVSYQITSKRGNRDQFAAMVAACHSAHSVGVKVLADTLFNHMSASESGIGVGGTSFTHYDYPGLYNVNNFHHCGIRPGGDVSDYGNRADVQTCELVNLVGIDARSAQNDASDLDGHRIRTEPPCRLCQRSFVSRS